MKRLLALLIVVAATFLIAQATPQFFPDIIVTGTNGIWTDTRFYADFNTALSAIGSSYRTVYILRGETLTTSRTILSNIGLRFFGAGYLSSPSGVTITFQTRDIQRSARYIFTGPGDFDFADGTIVRDDWFSGINNALLKTLDDSVVLQVNVGGRLTANRTSGSDVLLSFPSPGSEIVNNGYNLAVNGGFEAGVFQTFDDSSGGTVTLPSAEICYPENWGALADNTTNDSFEIQSAIDSNARVIVGNRTGYVINAPVIMDNAGQTIEFRNNAFFRQIVWGEGGIIVDAADVEVLSARVLYTGARTDLPNLVGNTYCCNTCEKEYSSGILLTSSADDVFIDNMYVYGQVSGVGACYTPTDYIENVYIQGVVELVDMGFVGKVLHGAEIRIDSTYMTRTQIVEEHTVYVTSENTTDNNENVHVYVRHDGENNAADAVGGIVTFKDCRNCTADINVVNFGNANGGTIFVSNTGGTGIEANVLSTGSVSITAVEGIGSAAVPIADDVLVSVSAGSEFVFPHINIKGYWTNSGADSTSYSALATSCADGVCGRMIAHNPVIENLASATPGKMAYVSGETVLYGPDFRMPNADIGPVMEQFMLQRLVT
jgi:hypothetical protein